MWNLDGMGHIVLRSLLKLESLRQRKLSIIDLLWQDPSRCVWYYFRYAIAKKTRNSLNPVDLLREIRSSSDSPERKLVEYSNIIDPISVEGRNFLDISHLAPDEPNTRSRYRFLPFAEIRGLDSRRNWYSPQHTSSLGYYDKSRRFSDLLSKKLLVKFYQ